MPVVGGLDIHRKQLTFDYPGTVTGQVTRGQVAPADREHLRAWLARFAGRGDDAAFAIEGCTGWRYVAAELAAAGIGVHLAEPAGTAWKAQIMSTVPVAPVTHAGDGLFADFRIAPPTAKSPGYDLDNLLDPVFSVVINSRGWFGGCRPNLRWVAARKETARETGVYLAVLGDPPDLWVESRVEVGLNDVYRDHLPSSAAVEDYAIWVQAI
jgi:hypothetical protein